MWNLKTSYINRLEGGYQRLEIGEKGRIDVRRTINFKLWNKFWEFHSMVTIVNNSILYHEAAEIVDLKCSHYKKVIIITSCDMLADAMIC